MSEPKFTPEEISVIDKNFGFMVFDWAKNLITHILTMARENGAKVVYMNTPTSLAVNAPVSNDMKAIYFYEKLPPMLGFKKEKVNLRGKGQEELWAYKFANDFSTAGIRKAFIKLADRQFTIEQLPSKYQGAFLGILGRRPFYTQEDINRVLEILKTKQGNKGKSGSKFYYDWESTKWTGGQRFDPKKSETVVLQRISDDFTNKCMSNPVLGKFLSFLISQSKHFSSDEIGFALVSKISPKIWVINEIQTDCINHYLDIRNKYYKERSGDKKKNIDWDTLKDMLRGRNRSKWIVKLEGNEPLKQQIIQNPNIIEQLPDDTQDIDKWIKEQRELLGDNLQRHEQLRQFLAETNFNIRVLRA